MARSVQIIVFWIVTPYLHPLKIEVVYSFEKLVSTYKTTRCHKHRSPQSEMYFMFESYQFKVLFHLIIITICIKINNTHMLNICIYFKNNTELNTVSDFTFFFINCLHKQMCCQFTYLHMTQNGVHTHISNDLKVQLYVSV